LLQNYGNPIQHAIGGWRQGDQEILRQPAHEEMHVPISGFEQASKALGGDGSRRPPGHLFQRFSSRVHGLYEDEPAEDETMAPAPHGRHATKHDSHKAREVSEGHHHVQLHLQREEQLPDRRRDMLYARRLFLMLRECSATGQFAGFWLVLRPNSAKWRLALTFVMCGRHGMALYHRSSAPAQQSLRRWAPVMPSLGFLARITLILLGRIQRAHSSKPASASQSRCSCSV
jgi:hypothetical protein